MTKGALIYCFDSDSIAYHKVANFCIKQIMKNLQLPVTVVTDQHTAQHVIDCNKIIVEPKKGNTRVYKDKTVNWLNLERGNAYDHSPYEHTLLMDADYFVYTDNLTHLLDTDCDFMLFNKVHDLTGRYDYSYDTKSMIPLVWATVVAFKKTERVRMLFDLIKHIKLHYQYFCDLYRIDFRNFRNDYAFAIAMNQMHMNNYIPAQMAMIPTDVAINNIDANEVDFTVNDKRHRIQDQDVHVLLKEIF